MDDSQPHRAPDATATDKRWLGPTILRVAGWPIESLDGLRSPALCKRIDDWIDNEEAIRRESDVLAIAVHEIISRLQDRTVRRLALDLKRRLHGGLELLPERLTEGLLKDNVVSTA